MKSFWRHTTPGDRWVVVLVLAISLALLARALAIPGGSRVVVKADQEVVYTAPLDEPRETLLSGPLGETRLRIDESGARITASPCPLKVCVGMGPAHRIGDLLVCLPNRILVQVEGTQNEEEGYDLLSR